MTNESKPTLVRLNQQKGAAFGDALLDLVREELNNCKGQWRRLERLSDGRLSYSWIVAFAAGRVQNSQITTVAECAKFLGINLCAVSGKHFDKFDA